jgi:DNA-binding NarL/FixJ family response regulator
LSSRSLESVLLVSEPVATAFPVCKSTRTPIKSTVFARVHLLRILIADDHETVRKGVCAILGARKDVEICGEASNGQEAVQKAFQLNPDLIILDVTMPVLGGFDAARQIKKLLPKVPILILSMHHGSSVVREAQLAGAQGYVTKSEAAHVLMKAVDAVLQGQTFFEQPPNP